MLTVLPSAAATTTVIPAFVPPSTGPSTLRLLTVMADPIETAHQSTEDMTGRHLSTDRHYLRVFTWPGPDIANCALARESSSAPLALIDHPRSGCRTATASRWLADGGIAPLASAPGPSDTGERGLSIYFFHTILYNI